MNTKLTISVLIICAKAQLPVLITRSHYTKLARWLTKHKSLGGLVCGSDNVEFDGLSVPPVSTGACCGSSAGSHLLDIYSRSTSTHGQNSKVSDDFMGVVSSSLEFVNCFFNKLVLLLAAMLSFTLFSTITPITKFLEMSLTSLINFTSNKRTALSIIACFFLSTYTLSLLEITMPFISVSNISCLLSIYVFILFQFFLQFHMKQMLSFSIRVSLLLYKECLYPPRFGNKKLFMQYTLFLATIQLTNCKIEVENFYVLTTKSYYTYVCVDYYRLFKE